MKEKIIPLHDKILIRREDKRRKTESGLHLPDTARVESQWGRVVSVGTGRVCEKTGALHKLCVRPGQRVLFKAFAPQFTMLVDGEELVLLCEDDILAIKE